MPVDFDLFYEWAQDHFGEENIKIKKTSHGVEICTNSVWSESKIGKTDSKFHLWMNTSGGKSKHPEFGSYRCWLTDEMGSLVGLVCKLSGIDWEEAESRICGTTSLRVLEQRVHDFFGSTDFVDVVVKESKNIDLPKSSYLINELLPNNLMRNRAEKYLADRKIPIDDMYVCIAGDFKNRIVIPYYNSDNELIYYNSRIMDEKNKMRYRKCDSVNKESVLYMTNWPKPKTKIYIMEGEFDAISLKLSGLVGCACGGKYLSDKQIDLIKNYEPVLAFDSDNAGLQAMVDIGSSLLEKGFPKISYVRPPKVYKDWNKLLKEKNVETVYEYIKRFEKPFTSFTSDILLSNKI